MCDCGEKCWKNSTEAQQTLRKKVRDNKVDWAVFIDYTNQKNNTLGTAVNQRGCKINTHGRKHVVGVLFLWNQFIKQDMFESVQLCRTVNHSASIYVVYLVKLQMYLEQNKPFIVQWAAGTLQTDVVYQKNIIFAGKLTN